MNVVSKPPAIMSSREFNQDTAKAKHLAAKGPVTITTRGVPTHVLMTKAEFDRLGKAEELPKQKFVSLAEALADKNPEADFEFDIPEFKTPFKGIEFD